MLSFFFWVPIWSFKLRICRDGKRRGSLEMLQGDPAHSNENINPTRSGQLTQPDHHGVDMIGVRRPVASDSTKCVQSKWLTSPILGWKTHTGACSSWVFRTMVIFLFFKTPYKMGVETSQKLARVLERKHYLLMSAQVGKEEEGVKCLIKEEIKWKRKTEPWNFKFEPATTFFHQLFQTAPSHCVFLCPFFCHFGVSARRRGKKEKTVKLNMSSSLQKSLSGLIAHAPVQFAFKKRKTTRQAKLASQWNESVYT